MYDWQPYVPVARRRANATHEVKRRLKGGTPAPVVITGRAIARTFWGKAWCENLEQYSDYASRLPRGRTYARNGSVVHLTIEPGRIAAVVAGSDIYDTEITVTKVTADRWAAVRADCASGIDSLVALLQGKLSDRTMARICERATGLFPAPRELRFSCSCPDSASMCKHVAAVLYGVGARFDTSPELVFALRGVDPAELVAAGPPVAVASSRVLATDDLSALFGIDLGEEVEAPVTKPTKGAKAAKGATAAKKPAKASSQTAKPAKASTTASSNAAKPSAKPRARR
ncbi:MAG: SWIM zinc finger family protein [Deltaproteobacteria bacterium]|nr:SWIM zinc finger family protein [Deltaproteobacteria bacterium]